MHPGICMSWVCMRERVRVYIGENDADESMCASRRTNVWLCVLSPVDSPPACQVVQTPRLIPRAEN